MTCYMLFESGNLNVKLKERNWEFFSLKDFIFIPLI